MRLWLSQLSQYRSYLMGFSILWIMLFHSHISIPGMLLPLDFLKTIGYAGVEIFFLLSGFGLAFSYKKNSDLGSFYLKRFSRILPTFWVCVTLMQVYRTSDGSFLLKDYLFAMSGMDFLVYGILTTWFIPAILCCYLLFPLYWQVSLKYGPARTLIAFTIVTFSITISLVGTTIEHLLIFLIRLPVFFLGVYVGQTALGYSRDAWTKNITPILLVGGIFLGTLIYVTYNVDHTVLVSSGLRWYPTALMALPVTILLCKILELIENLIPQFLKLLSVFGVYSLELYLLHLITFELPKVIDLKHFGWNILRIPEYTCYVLLALLLALVVHRVLEPVSNLNLAKTESNRH